MAAADWLAAFLYRLITTTDATLSDIASARGFYDLRSFARQFSSALDPLATLLAIRLLGACA